MGLFASRETGLRWFGVVWRWFGANMAGLRNIRNTNAFKFILQVFILSQKHILGVKKVVWCGLDVVWGGLEVVWRWFGVVWWWFGVNMAGLRNIHNTNAFKFILQVFILSQKHIMGVKKVVWCGIDVVWGGLVVVWGGLGWFGVFPRTGLILNIKKDFI